MVRPLDDATGNEETRSVSKRILIVDDDPVQRRLLKAAAEKAGYEVELANEGRSALARLVEPDHELAAVVLDLMMPEMGGLEVLERLSAIGSTIPVVVQTGQGGIETVVKAMRAGAFDFVVKPVSPERLTLALGNALKAARITSSQIPSSRVMSASMASLRQAPPWSG
jgi:DNA-binding NtrC family response regulator